MYSQKENELLWSGVKSYQAGNYYEAHEDWEELWSDRRLMDRNIVHGLIQVSVSLFHSEQENLKGARSMIQKALPKFHGHTTTWNGLDLAPFVQSCIRWQKHVNEVLSVENINPSFKPELKEVNNG